MAKKNKKQKPLWFVAGLLAWLVPGMGHVYLGRVKRGVILFITITATFWAGVAVGGVMTVDSRYDRWWFYAQSLTGAHGLIGWYRQEKVYEDVGRELKIDQIAPAAGGRPDSDQMRIDSKLQEKGIVLANPSEGVARPYSGIAGLLNLLCIFDAGILGVMGCCGEPRRDEKNPPRKEGQKA